jgi:hypothetical protein
MERLRLLIICSFFGAFYIIAFYSGAFIISKALFSVILSSIPYINKIVAIFYVAVVSYLYHKEKRIELRGSRYGKDWSSSR